MYVPIVSREGHAGVVLRSQHGQLVLVRHCDVVLAFVGLAPCSAKVRRLRSLRNEKLSTQSVCGLDMELIDL